MRRSDGLRPAIFAGLLAVAAVAGLSASNLGGFGFTLREAFFDRMIALHPRTGPDTRVYAVDIDRTSLEKLGPWPWRRKTIAALIENVATKRQGLRPRAVALDILLEGADRNGPRAILSAIAGSENRPELAKAAAAFADEDGLVASSANKGTPVIFGIGIAPRPATTALPSLVLATADNGRIDLRPVDVPGFSAPPPPIAANAAGLGVLSLDTDADGKMRRVPLVFASTNPKSPALHAGLAVETVRAAQGVGTVFYNSRSRLFEIGKASVPARANGQLRLYPREPGYWRAHTIPAWRVFQDPEKALRPFLHENAVFVIGSSAPQAGAYLPTAFAGAQPTLRIQTMAIDQLRSGRNIMRAGYGPVQPLLAETMLALLAGVAATIAAVYLSPLPLVLTVAGAIALLGGAAYGAFSGYGVLIDLLPVAGAILFGALAASLTTHAYVRANRARVEARFARYLDPAVVDILSRNPHRLRIEPQRREVTAIFTDLEGFTPFSERTDPADLVAVLDRYFELIADAAVRHGGMVDKIVGDAIHVFFNMPLDQPDHVQRALACVRTIAKVTEDYRNEPRQKALGLGRTRIGMDTGLATVGDIGGGVKLDYTAHGEAINRAARLQSMARDYPSGILIGEGAASRLPSPDGLQYLGEATPRGLSEAQKIYTLI
ncbi:MAG: adenylate/guanylate cyclase domain-containing protein [Hyphomicrobiales bacterium]|nr:adenylate/guanylate cyclase domain-containing protein [Hyphomicrobiales bacterium]